jgi:hypothetical protein
MICGEYVLKYGIYDMESSRRVDVGDGIFFRIGPTAKDCLVDFGECRSNEPFSVRIEITDVPKRVLFALRNIEEWSVPPSEEEIRQAQEDFANYEEVTP